MNRRAFDREARWVAVGFGCGYAPYAPGTAGSLLGVAFFVAFAFSFSGIVPSVFSGIVPSVPVAGVSPSLLIAGYGLTIAGLFVLGCWAAGRAESQFGRHDDGRIVIDEVVGQMLALSPLLLWPLAPSALAPASLAPASLTEASGASVYFGFFLWVVTGFVLFRLFDVWKPGAIGWAERRFKGGLGVMADDMMAGLYAGACLLAAQTAVHAARHAVVGGSGAWIGAHA